MTLFGGPLLAKQYNAGFWHFHNWPPFWNRRVRPCKRTVHGGGKQQSCWEWSRCSWKTSGHFGSDDRHNFFTVAKLLMNNQWCISLAESYERLWKWDTHWLLVWLSASRAGLEGSPQRLLITATAHQSIRVEFNITKPWQSEGLSPLDLHHRSSLFCSFEAPDTLVHLLLFEVGVATVGEDVLLLCH